MDIYPILNLYSCFCFVEVKFTEPFQWLMKTTEFGHFTY